LVTLTRSSGRAHFSGLTTCGSVWACPCCSARINAARADELSAALESWHARGGTVALLTLTMRHNRRQALSDLWDALSPAIAASLGGRYSRARRAKAAAGFNGYALTREATHGANGWHLHAHALVFLDSPSGAACAELEAAIYAAWSKRLVRAGLDAPSRERGARLQVLNLAEAREHAAAYLAKGTYEATRAAGELTGGSGKRAGGGNRTPWDLLAAYSAHSRPADLALWREWEGASSGRRALTWSVGLRATLELGQERGDEELAEEAELAEVVLLLDKPTWRTVAAAPHGPANLLAAAERAGTLAEARRACKRTLWQCAPRAGPPPRAAPVAA
jgi:hypothetical protein